MVSMSQNAKVSINLDKTLLIMNFGAHMTMVDMVPRMAASLDKKLLTQEESKTLNALMVMSTKPLEPELTALALKLITNVI